MKDKAYIGLAYMTGILPIKKYGTHSALNMFAEYSMTNAVPLDPYMGFTTDEVSVLCEKNGIAFDEEKNWYDGYSLKNIGDIYSPRSVVQVMKTGIFDDYWNQTETFDAAINVSDESIVNAKEGDPLALHRFIEAIIGKLDVKDKIRILQDEYGIRMTSGMEGRLMNMCNLSSSLVEKGLERGIEQGIEQGIQKTQRETVLRMNDRGYDISTISDLTGLPLTDVKRIIEENQ